MLLEQDVQLYILVEPSVVNILLDFSFRTLQYSSLSGIVHPFGKLVVHVLTERININQDA